MKTSVSVSVPDRREKAWTSAVIGDLQNSTSAEADETVALHRFLPFSRPDQNGFRIVSSDMKAVGWQDWNQRTRWFYREPSFCLQGAVKNGF
jgi:hypothetical protein